MALFTACDSNDESGVGSFDSNTQIVLTFVTSADGTSTRASTYDLDDYEEGVGYENYIDFSGNDYKIYFFSNTATDTKGGTLIAEFTPDEISTTGSGNTYTTYTLKGKVPEALMGVRAFKVVMLANWGSYPTTIEVGTTTIDALCEGDNTTYNASNKFTIDGTHLIPFYGVQEYSGIEIREGVTTTLTTPVSLLRAVAKVEVILTADSDYDAFETVSIVNYNAQGYCAPWGVYTAADYDTEMNNNPSSGKWSDEWVKGLHLVGGENNPITTPQSFTKVAEATTTPYETWRIYLPEYDNSADDYSYISLTVDGEEYEIYFADYDDNGATDSTADYDIKRNNLYRFYVTLKNRELRVFVETWENVFDNEWSFGNIEPLKKGDTFTLNNFMYEVLTSTAGENPDKTLTVSIMPGGTYTSEVEIPSTVRHNGFTYTVTAIGNNTFDGQVGIATIIIPETVTTIGSLAFQDCRDLTSLYIYNYSPPTCEDYAFQQVEVGNITLYVPYQVLDTYMNDETWGTFGFMAIDEIPGTEPETNP